MIEVFLAVIFISSLFGIAILLHRLTEIKDQLKTLQERDVAEYIELNNMLVSNWDRATKGLISFWDKTTKDYVDVNAVCNARLHDIAESMVKAGYEKGKADV